MQPGLQYPPKFFLKIGPCHGCRDCKFNLNQTEPQTLDAKLGVQGYWALCSLVCKQQFLKNWLRLHFEVAAQRLGEPDAAIMATPTLEGDGSLRWQRQQPGGSISLCLLPPPVIHMSGERVLLHSQAIALVWSPEETIL